MKKMKKILAFSLSVIMVLSMLTCVSFASAEENALPIGTYVMNADWAGMQEMETVTCVLGGKEYVLEYGVTAVSSIDEALLLPRPVGMKPTIILAPGRYGNMTISSNIILAGPYFGQAPFNNPFKDNLYDSSLEDMAITNGRSIDATKEAVLTGIVTLADGCTDFEIDGIAMTGGAQITDSKRSANNSVGKFTFEARNIFSKDTSGSMFILNDGTALSRYLYFKDCYFGNASGGISPRSEVIELDGVCFDGGRPIIYHTLIDPANVLTETTESYFNVYNSCFRNLDANGFLNQAVGVNNSPNASDRDTIYMNVVDNFFQDIGDPSLSPKSWNIRPQIASKHSYTLKNNTFLAVTKPDITPIWFFQSSTAVEADFVLEDNVFINTKYPARTTSLAPVDISRNFFCTSEGVRTNPTTEATMTYNGYYYDASLSVGTFDFTITNSNMGSVKCDTVVAGAAKWTATVYCDGGVYTPDFTFEKDDVEWKLYSDSACTQELTSIDTSSFTSGEMKAYMTVARLGRQEKFTVTFTTAASPIRDVISIENATLNKKTNAAVVTVSEYDKEYTLPTVGAGATLSKGASIEYYADPFFENKVSTVTVKSGEITPTLYAKVIAANGEFDVWTFDYVVTQDEIIDTGASDKCDLIAFDVPGAKDIEVGSDYILVEMKDNATSFNPVVTVSDGASYAFYADAEGTITSADNTKFTISSSNVASYLFITAEDGVSQNVYSVFVTSNRSPVKYADESNISSYAKEAVATLNNSGLGLFLGDQNSKFNPKNNITRYEVAVLMTKVCSINVDLMDTVDVSYIFADFEKIPSWALPYVKASYVSGLIAGAAKPDGKLYFDGSVNTTREQFITILMRAIVPEIFGMSIDEVYSNFELQIDTAFVKANVYDENSFSSFAAKAIKIAIALELVNGAPYKDGVKINPKQPITRQDTCVIIANLLV